jgi:hypothetical protein
MHAVNTEAQADDISRFAADLRSLRLEASSPTLARLQAETGISRTVLSEAFAGRQLPSARTVDGIVRVCGGDTAVWIPRRDALAAATTAAVLVAETGKPRRTMGRRGAWLLAAGAFVVGCVVSGTVAALIVTQIFTDRMVEAGVNVAPQIAVTTGEDPALTPCVDDAEVATGDTRADNSLLEIVWSNKCYAGWGRLTRYDGLGEGNTVTIAIYPQTAPDGPDRQEATEHDVQGAYTTLVVRPTPDTLLCAEGSFTVDGERIDLGDPLCI